MITTEQEWIAAATGPLSDVLAVPEDWMPDVARALWPLVEPLVTRAQAVRDHAEGCIRVIEAQWARDAAQHVAPTPYDRGQVDALRRVIRVLDGADERTPTDG